MALKGKFIKILNEYGKVYDEVWSTGKFRNPLLDYFNTDVKQEVKNFVDKINPKLIVHSSTGAGRTTVTPWIAVMDTRIATGASQGVYVVYLFNKDSKVIYLALSLSSEEAENEIKKQGFSGREKTRKVQESVKIKKQELLKKLDTRKFFTDENVNSGKKEFDQAVIAYKAYSMNSIPDDDQLESDLAEILSVYENYAEICISDSLKKIEKTTSNTKNESGENPLSVKEMLEEIKKYIRSRGFIFDDGLIENYYLSLKSKPFVILAGTSGTGKTRLVRLFAEAIGATNNNGRYKLVPVRPDWSDSSDLFGHVDLNGKFIPGAITDFIKAAEMDKDKPYFLCLDEMNLARVEYYLSDILSVIETRELVNGEIVTDSLVSGSYYGADNEAKEKYGLIRIPENLYIVGTVNMDETTFPFSRKVLDRANTIEFSTVDFGLDFSNRKVVEAQEIDNSFMKANYVFLKQCTDSSDHLSVVQQTCAELQKINNELEKANAHVGYRVRDEISFYMLNNEDIHLLSRDEAMDNEIMQKILPRIQGSSSAVKNMLCELFKIFAGDYEGFNTENDNVSDKMFGWIKNKNCKYKHSAEKIAYMVRRFEEDGFTAYWL